MRARVGICVATAVSAVLVPIAAQGENGAQATTAAHDARTTTAFRTPLSAPLRAPATASIRAVPLDSSYDTPTRSVSRDIGVSVALPDGNDLWFFGDTGIFQRSGQGGWTETTFIDGSSALEAKYTRGQVPRGAEVPSGSPSRFVPVPSDVYMPDGSGRRCTYPIAAFAARWPSGATVLPSDTAHVLVTYTEVCVTQPARGQPRIRAEGWGYLLYNWRTRHIDRGPIDVFKPQSSGAVLAPSRAFGWPVFANGELTLFSSECTARFITCASGRVWFATVPTTPSALDKPASYDPRVLSTDGSAKWEPMGISVGRYPTGLHLVETASIGGTYRIFSAPSASARWHLDRSGTLPGCPAHTGFCFGLEGHPELSTPTNIFISYKDPDAGPGGHIVLSAVPY